MLADLPSQNRFTSPSTRCLGGETAAPPRAVQTRKKSRLWTGAHSVKSVSDRDELPVERCLRRGADCLSLRECLSLILSQGKGGRSPLGAARKLLERPGKGLGPAEEERALFTALETSAEAHLASCRKLSPQSKASVLAAFELGRRYHLFSLSAQTVGPSRLHSKGSSSGLPEQAIDRVPFDRRQEPREWLGFVPVHRNGALGQFCLVDRGVRTHVNIDPAELFARILAVRPRAFYLFHNHPSGELTPSAADHHLTEQVQRLAEALGIRLLGHGILTAQEERWIV